MNQHRQGDTLLVKTKKPKETGKPIAQRRITIALGETTGHAHVLEGEVAEFLINGQRMIWVEAPATYTHEEHAPHTIMPGWYVAPQQVEYTPQEIRRVTD